jgi:drug/metabolite transporter (DMT)-like permease
MAVGLLLLLFIGRWKLGERVGKRELVCVIAIIIGISGLGFAGPSHTTEHAPIDQLAAAIALLASVAALPVIASFTRYRGQTIGYLAAMGAGLWYACGSLSAKFIADGISDGIWTFAIAWIAAAILVALLGLLSESTALQSRPASRVSPVIFVVEMLIPVFMAPVLASEHWSTHPSRLGILLGSLLLVVAATAALASSEKLAAFGGRK